MTREEIVKALRECSSGNMNCSKCPMWDSKLDLRCMDAVMMSAADMLEQDAKKTRWISVKDRLPEKTMLVLGVVHGHVGELAYINNRNLFERRERPIEGVTHWMPLPEPPEEEK